MQWSNDERQRFINVLDGFERVIVFCYRMMLVLIILAVVGFTAFVIVRQPFGAGNQGEWFYFGVAVLFVLGWAMGQLFISGQRQPLPNAVLSLFSNQSTDGARTWQLQFGSLPTGAEQTNPPADSTLTLISQCLEIPLASVTREMLPDDAAIASIEYELERGTSLEDACRYVQPHYDEWNSLQQHALTLYVSRVLEQRARNKSSTQA